MGNSCAHVHIAWKGTPDDAVKPVNREPKCNQRVGLADNSFVLAEFELYTAE
jgi:hypothetical protein